MDKTIFVTVKDRVATAPADARYICGNSDFIVHFSFDEEWSEYNTKTARFIYGGQYSDVVFEGNVCEFPAISNVLHVMVGVFAGNLRTTTAACVYAKKSILCGSGTPAAPSEDVYSQIMELLNSGNGTNGKDGFSPTVALAETADGVEIAVTDKDGTKTATVYNGKDGQDGAPGEKGEKGDTGPAGAQGPKGDTGPQGEQGPAGADGKPGDPGKDGATGPAGPAGADGITPRIGSNGNWFIGDEDTGVSAGGGGSTGGSGGGGGIFELLMDVTITEEVKYIYQSFDPVSVSELLIYSSVVSPAEIANTNVLGVWPVFNATKPESAWSHGGISLPTASSAMLSTAGSSKTSSFSIKIGNGAVFTTSAMGGSATCMHPGLTEGDLSAITSLRFSTQNMTNNFGVGTRIRMWGLKA